MYSEEFKKYLENNLSTVQILEVNRDIDSLVDYFTNIKQSLANKISASFMKNDTEHIHKYIDYGQEINNIINAIESLWLSDEYTYDDQEDDIDNQFEKTSYGDNNDNNSFESSDDIIDNDSDINNTKDNDYLTLCDDESTTIPEQNVDKIKLTDIIVTSQKHRVCPICYEHLENKSLVFTRFSDKNRTEKIATGATYIKECPNCKRRYITYGTAKALKIETTDLNPIHENTAIKNTTSSQEPYKYKYCIICGEKSWNGTPYCRKHYEYKHYESK